MSAPPPRLFLDHPLHDGAVAPLDAGQVHYLRTVLRKSIGEEIRAFNGRDGEWSAALQDLAKKSGTVRATRRTRVQIGEPDVHLLFAPLKKGSTDLLAQKATELGVSALRPVLTARTNAARVNVDRMRANVVEGAEQTERLTVPAVAAPATLAAALDAWDGARKLLFCDEAGDDDDTPWGGASGRARPMLEVLADAGRGDPWAVLIGPEGGFTPDERRRLRGMAQTVPVSLGPRILRADTAAIAALALWQARLGDWVGARPRDWT